MGSPTPDVPSPASRSARYWLLAVLASAAGVALVVVLYDREILPIAGPFVLLALAPLLLPVVERGQRRKAERRAGRGRP